MKTAFLASVATAAPAFAADLPTTKGPPPVPVVTAYDWTGIFFGGNLGWAWDNGSFNAYSASTGAADRYGSNNFNSFIGGGQVGYRYMFPQRFVIGSLASLDWNTSNSVTNSEYNAFGDFLPYAVGGWAWNDETITNTQLF
jgi:outer membrane immunogenic protein